MNAVRAQAKRNYEAALKVERAAQDCANQEAWHTANEALRAARLALVKAELEFPLPHEIKKQDNLLRLRNRGLDV